MENRGQKEKRVSLRWKTYGMSFRNSHRVANILNLDQIVTIFRSDLDPNNLQRLSADNRSRQSISHEYKGALHWVTLYVGVML